MQLNLEIPSLTVGQEVESQKFAIGNLAVILHLLRSKMYSNPIRTIIQEISSNARDANREVGNGKKPISIHLPTKEEPELWIQDEGPGITPERMSGVYLQYGNSTKRESNDQTGCFGLGAKSPFAYCSSFGIETITPENGKNVLRIYIATVDASQIGKVLLVHTMDTDKPCGTTIKVPVKPQDFDEFKRWTNIVLNRWNPLPKVNMEDVFDFVYEPDVIGENWEIYTSRSVDRGFYYYEDGIPYKVDDTNIENMPEEFEVFFNKVRLNVFGKGKVQVTGNRESLDYQPHVIQHLKDQMAAIFKEVNLRLTNEVASCTGLWDAMCMVHKTQEHWGVDILKDVQWGGLPVPNKHSYDLQHANVYEVEGDSEKIHGVKMKMRRRYHSISARPSNLIIENSNPNRPNAAYVGKAWEFAKKHFENYNNSWNLYIVGWHDSPMAIKEKESIRFSEWNLHKLEEFKPERKPRVKGVRTGYGSPARVRTYNKNAYSNSSYEDKWNRTELDLSNPDGGIYVILHARAVEDTTITEDQIGFFANQTDKVVYGIPRRFAERDGKLALGSQWIPFKTAVSQTLDEMIQKEGNIVWQSEYETLPYHVLDSEINGILQKAIATGSVNGKISNWFKVEKAVKTGSNLHTMARICDREKDITVRNWTKADVKELLQLFPLVIMWNGTKWQVRDLMGQKNAEKLLAEFTVSYVQRQEALENARLAALEEKEAEDQSGDSTPKVQYGLLKVQRD